MLREDHYTNTLLELAKTVKVLNGETGYFTCAGFMVHLEEGEQPRCECGGYRADCECEHLDAVWFMLDSGKVQA